MTEYLNLDIKECELIRLTKKVCQIGKKMGYEPDQFAIMLSIVSEQLCETQGIEITSHRSMDA